MQIGITKNTSIGADYYFGVIHTTAMSIGGVTSFNSLKAWNRFGLIAVDYKLGK